MSAPPPGAARPASAFAPFGNRAFRLLWTANVLSNTGGWMATTGAAWEMTSLTQEPIFVALLSAAGTLPMFLFCFFAGVLADRFDRRRYIIVCQVWMMGVAAALAVLAFFGQLDHWSLLGLIPTDRTHDSSAHRRLVMDAILCGVASRSVQALQQASTMAS